MQKRPEPVPQAKISLQGRRGHGQLTSLLGGIVLHAHMAIDKCASPPKTELGDLAACWPGETVLQVPVMR